MNGKKVFILFGVWLLSIASIVNAQTTRTVGSGGNYTSLRSAFVAINNGNITGAIILQIISNTNETNSCTLNASGTGSANYTSVIIYPTGSGYTIGGNLTAPLIDLSGADNVTIDGRVNSTGSVASLIITNTNTANQSSTIRFINSAENNTIKYCTVKGSESSSTKGVFFFSTSTSGNGNDGNTIDNCNITNASGRPINIIYSAGTASRQNSGNTISNNNIYDFLNASNASYGINLAGNTTAWIISGNSFYETTSFAPSSTVAYIILRINNTSGVNFTITGNYIGGKASLCGSTAWTKINSRNNTFTAINLSVGTSTVSNIQNNTIQNFAWNNSGSAAWTGISVTAGAVNIGTTAANTIGANTGTGSITITGAATGTIVYGIAISGAGTISCQNNNIGSITTSNATTSASNIYAINRTSTGTTIISNNLIGSTTQANSIRASSTSTSNAQSVIGINNTTGGSLTISNNTIANLTNGTTNTNATTAGGIAGVRSSNATNTVTNNTIFNITVANANTSATQTASICGIAMNGSTLKTITGNTIYNLSNTYASFAGNVIGLYFQGNTGNNVVSRNFIHSLSATGASSTSASIYGIKINAGATTYSNNIIYLGGNTRTTLYGIYETGGAGNNNCLYFNTVFIAGSLSSGITNKSYALYSVVNTNTRDFRNNILVNIRSTTGGSGLHYAAYFNYTVGTSLTLDFNNYYVSGTGGVLGYYNGANVNSIPLITGLDVNSLGVDPVFTSAGSTISTDYTPTCNKLAGTTISSVSIDYSTVNRAGTPTIGAFEITLDLNIDVYKSGAFQSSYLRLKDAFDKINSGKHTGALEIRIKVNTTETASAVLYQSGYSGAGGISNYTSVSIYPTVTGLFLNGNFAAPLVLFDGADRVTIDGRVNKTGSTRDLVIANTETGTSSSTIRFINSAENNTVKYCNIQGAETNASMGVIHFSTSLSGNGNDGNTIDNNNITGDVTSRPVAVIYSSGTVGSENSGIIISNNNIYDFLNTGVSSHGINIASNSIDWTITGNSFYETTTFVPTGAYSYHVIDVSGSTNHVISSNYIGGSAASCGGSAWTINSSQAHYFFGIYVTGGTSASCTIQNNLIKNINYTSTWNNPWNGIYINDGNVDVTGNTIGATTGSGSITITAQIDATSNGIISNGAGTVNISGNNIGSITTVGSDNYSHGLVAISLKNASGITTIDENLIGSSSTSGSLHASSTAVLSLQKQDLYGIFSTSTGSTTITNNTIDNLTNAYSGTSTVSLVRGIQTTSGNNTIQNNIVRNISTSNGQSGTLVNASLVGISQASGTAGTTQNVSGNSVYNLSNTASTAKVNVYGIFYSGPPSGVNTVSGNFIHSLSISSSDITSAIDGIEIDNGLTTYANNIINLGVGITNGYKINGICDESGPTNRNDLYFNTVYIGGSISSGETSPTTALNNEANTSVRNYRNNVLFNARSGGTTGKHYAIALAGIANLTIDYNDYYVTGTNGILGIIGTLEKTDLAVWQLGTVQDVNSLNFNPAFSLTGGTFPGNYYVSADLPGVDGTGITYDYSDVSRGTIPKMGALEVNEYIWQGGTSSDFGTASNWTLNMVPVNGADIAFSAAPDHDCVLDKNRTLRNITNDQSSYKFVLNGKKLTIKGSLLFTSGAQIDATATSSSAVFAGSLAQSIPSGSFVNNTVDTLCITNSYGLTLHGDFTIQASLILTSGTFSIGANSLSLNGIITKTAGTLTGGSSSNIIIGGSGANMTLPAVSLNNLTLNRANDISLIGTVSVGGTLTLTNGTLILGANNLIISGNSPARTSGTIDASNAGAALLFTNSTAITLPASIFTGEVNNLTINGTGGITANYDFTVKGVLNLQSDNPSSTKGSLDMWDGFEMKTLTMGANATTIGVGDVTGIIKRTTIIPTVTYTFGNAFTSATFPDWGILPTEMSLKITIGTAPSWRLGAINREIEVIQTGGSDTKAILRLHYLDTELNGNDKEKLVFWVGLPVNVEYGRSDHNTMDNWVSISNVNVAFYSSSWDATKNSTLDEYSTISTLIWTGSASDSWTAIENWTPNVGPSANKNIIIPDGSTTPFDPTLPDVNEIKSLTIQAGGILNAVDSAQLTINGLEGAWSNVGGTFNPATSNIIFTNPYATISGATNFYDVTIADSAGLIPSANNIMRIADTLRLEGTAVLRAAFSPNTIEYKGTNQLIVNPNGLTPGYYNLILSGSGTKTLPVTALSIAGDFSISGTASTTADSTITFGGNVFIGDGTTFTTGGHNHSIGGNFNNNGTFTVTAGNTITMNGSTNQSIGGLTSTSFDILVINNSQGVTLNANENINGELILTNGNLNIGSFTLGLNKSISKTSGYIQVGLTSSLSFGGTDAIIIPDNLFTAVPSFNNLTINRSGGVTLGNQNMKVNGLLDLSSGIFTLGANTLTIAGNSVIKTSGSIDASDGAATLVFTNTSAITLPASIFMGNVNNLTVNCPGGVTVASDFTVTGLLYLQSENPSSAKGSLDMWDGSTIKTLTMGADATTVGVGDVTGIIKRTTFNPGTSYTFGNQFTTITFYSGGTAYPSEIQAKISIGASPSWKTDAINRLYDISQTGADNCFATLAYHYLNAELNGNDEDQLIHLVYGDPGPPVGLYEGGRSNFNISDNWVSANNINIQYLATSFGMLQSSLGESETTSLFTWNGSQSSSWIDLFNWTPTGLPSAISNVIIPDAATTMNSPTLPDIAEIATLTIEAGGVLNGAAGSQFTINGGNGAWINDGGTFNASTSNVIFTNSAGTIAGTTNFYDATINSGASLSMTSGSIMRISGAVTNNGTWQTVIGGPTTVEYYVGDQTIVVPNPAMNAYFNLILSGSGTKTMPTTQMSIYGDITIEGSVTATLGAVLSVAGNITMGVGTTLDLASFSHTVGGNFTNNGGNLTSANSSVTFNGTGSQTITTVAGFSVNDLTIANTSANVILGSSTNCSVSGDLTTEIGAVFDLASNTLTGITGALSNAGTIKTGNTSAAPFPSGKTWGGYVEFTGSGSQTIIDGTYNNLTISGSGGTTANTDIVVNGILNLSSANPSAIKGILDLGINTLLMGASATTIGQGDVTGIIRRTTILPNTTYTFGNQFTTVYFPNVGTLPDNLSLKITIGSLPTWRPGAIKRILDVIQTGGSGTQALMRTHYLDSELNGNNESQLVYWVHDFGVPYTIEYGRSAFDTVSNYLTISNVNVAFYSSGFGVKESALDESETLFLTWNGSTSSSWVTATNWTPNGAPSDNTTVTIPDAGTTNNDPSLPLVAACSRIILHNGAILNSNSDAQLTLTGADSTWRNSGGAFNAGNSTIIFKNSGTTMNGSTDFNNIIIDFGANLGLQANTYLGIAGTLANNGTIETVANGATTVEYKGADQTIVTTNSANNRYSTLVLSGSGIKTMPDTELTINGNFNMSGTVTVTAGSAITIVGNATIGNGTTFITGSHNHSVGGNFTNNGDFTISSGNTITMNGVSSQAIAGTSSTYFDNLTINNSQGVTLLTDEIVNNALTLTSGNLIVGSTTLRINGTIGKTSGYIDVTGLSSLNFGGTDAITLNNNLFASTPSINNLSINRTGGITLGNQNMTVNGLLDLPSGTFSLAANTLTIAGSSPTRTSGTIDAGNAGATLAFINDAAIILPTSIFTGDVNNLTINGAGGITSSSDFTVNGILNLQSDNPSTTKGSLDMWDGSDIKSLNMGEEATTIGVGDVTGIVVRTSAFVANKPYTFGNQFTTITFAPGGTYPTQIQSKTTIGSSPSWKPEAIMRVNDYIRTGGSGCFFTFTNHYHDTELNGNDEGKLVRWKLTPPSSVAEVGRSDYDTTDNWVANANISIANFPTIFGSERTLANSELEALIWNGSVSDVWATQENWTPRSSPSNLSNITIPDAATTLYSPTLPSSTEIKTINIKTAGVLNAITNAQLTLNGGSGAWVNTDGIFNPGTSNVLFTNTAATISGTTNFFDVTINSGATLSMSIGSFMGIAGTITNDGTWNADIGGTTVEYNGGGQAVVIPNPATNSYNTLILSGSGVKTMPDTALDIYADFSASDSAIATLLAEMTVGGDLTIESGCSISVSPLSNLTVSGTTANNADVSGLILLSDAIGTASFVHNTDNVPATVERYISGVAEAWHFLSSPVSDQLIADSWLPSGTYGNGTGYDMYVWNEPNSCWIYQLDNNSPINWNTIHPGNDFTIGRGYLYSVQATNPTKEFVGNLNNGPINYDLTFSSDNASLKGFNLVGNPYPSSIDWSAALGWTRTDLNNSGGGYDMWIWNPMANNYGVYNSADADGTGTNSVTRYIAPMQGYFVQAAAAGNLNMDNAVRVHDGAGNWFKSTKQVVSKVSVGVKSDAGYGSDEIQIGFGYDDNENGAMKLFSKVLSAPSLYMTSKGDYLSVLYLTRIEDNPAVPLQFTPGMNGNYTINCNFDQSKFETIMLEDRQMNYIQNMKTEKNYNFNASKSDNANRFVLHFGPVDNQTAEELPATIYTNGNQLIVDLTLISKVTDVFVYDIMGRLLLQQKLQGETSHELTIDTSQQILIVCLKNPDGSISRKLFLSGNQLS